MREFWLRLAEDFEDLDERKVLKKELSGLKQYLESINLQVEDLSRQVQRCAHMLEDKTQEIERLTVALRNAEGEVEQEREHQRVRIAHHRASVCFNICIIGLLKFLGTPAWQSRIRNAVLRSDSSKKNSNLGRLEPLQEDHNSRKNLSSLNRKNTMK